ncbi:MAG: SDR family oxidoreductase [Pseudomonadota bacterium]
MPTTLITGANRGIGLALAQTFVSRGHDVIATARDPHSAADLKATGASVYRLDVTDHAAIAVLAKELDGTPIDILINNAGVGGPEARTALGGLDYPAFRHVLEVNTLAPLAIAEAFTPHVAASELKIMAVISSQLGSIEISDGAWGLIYRTSKAAVNMAFRSAAVKLAEDGITTLTLHPGHVETDMGGQGAPVKPAESAKGLADVILGASPSKTLRFLDWQGETLPW